MKKLLGLLAATALLALGTPSFAADDNSSNSDRMDNATSPSDQNSSEQNSMGKMNSDPGMSDPGTSMENGSQNATGSNTDTTSTVKKKKHHHHKKKPRTTTESNQNMEEQPAGQ